MLRKNVAVDAVIPRSTSLLARHAAKAAKTFQISDFGFTFSSTSTCVIGFARDPWRLDERHPTEVEAKIELNPRSENGEVSGCGGVWVLQGRISGPIVVANGDSFSVRFISAAGALILSEWSDGIVGDHQGPRQ